MQHFLRIFLAVIFLAATAVVAQTVTFYDDKTADIAPRNITFDDMDNLWISGDAASPKIAAMVTADMSTWTYYDTTELRIAELGDDEVYEIGAADNGTACFLTHYGISYMDSEGNVEVVSGSEGTYTKGFVVDGNVLYWTYDGTPLAVLYEYDLETEQQVGAIYDTDAGMTSGPSHLTVYDGARDAAGQLWLCTHWGVIYEDTQGDWHTILDGLYPDNLVSDKDGNIWITYGDYPYNDTLMQVNSNNEVLAKYSPADIPELGWLNGAVDLETDANGHAWIVTDSVGIIDFAGPGDYTLYNEIDAGDEMLDLRDNVRDLEIRNDEVWLALWDGRLAKIDDLIQLETSETTVTFFDTETADIEPQNITFDGMDNLWISGDAASPKIAAMVTADMSTWTYYDTTELRIAELGDDEVYEIGAADNGTACFLTHYGISYMDSEGNVEVVSGSEGTYTKGFVVDGNVLYWTYDGTPLAVLYEYDLETEQQVGAIYDTDAGMTSGPSHLTVYDGARDAAGQLWLCTHWGVIYEDTQGDWHTILDGLYPDNLVSDKDGNIWITYGDYPYNDTLMQVNSNNEVLAKYSPADIPELGWLNGAVDLETDANGHAWIVTDSVGIIDFAGPGDYTLYNEIDAGDEMLDLRDNVRDLEIRNDEVWLVLWDGRLVRIEGLITVTAIDDDPQISIVPESMHLHQNYPNPFNPSTRISFELNKSAQIDLSVYNMRGQLVKTIASRKYSAGRHTVNWNGADAQGNRLASGVYIYRLSTDGHQISKKMIMVK